MCKQYGLWCINPISQSEGGWVLDNEGVPVKYSSEAAAKRDLKTFVSTSYEIKEYKDDHRPRSRPRRRRKL